MNILKDDDYDINNFFSKLKFLIRNIIEFSLYGYIKSNKFILFDYVTFRDERLGIVGKIDDIVYIFLRGTKTFKEMYFELMIKSKNIHGFNCHNGFIQLFNESNLSNIINKIATTKNKIITAGYSLGGSLTMVSSIIMRDLKISYEAYSFGGPNICFDNGIINDLYLIKNEFDIIPDIYATMPYIVNVKYHDIGKNVIFSKDEKCFMNNHSLVTYYKAMNDKLLQNNEN